MFDQGNRLASATGKASYVYDGLGRRVRTTKTDGSNLIHVYSQAGELLYSSTAVGAATPVETLYVNLNGHLLAEVGGAYVHTDGLGSPIARTNAARAVISRTRYEPYGLTASGTTPTVGYTGHVNDADTGLVYMQQRYYDPVAARFLSIDPVTTDANTGGSFNRYNYANNSPYRYIDPDGRDAADKFGDQFKKDAEAGNSGVYEPFHTPVVIATIGMVVGPPIAAAVIGPAEVAVVGGVGAKAAAQVAKVAAPTEAQAKNIQRFTSKLPANAKDSVTVKPLPNGGVAAQGVSPGKVPGSSALYEKQIDSAGKTIQYTKTITAPNGAIVHVKDKITGNVVTP